MNLRGAVSVVTGAGTGLGRAMALRLAQDGAVVAIVDKDGPSAVATAQEADGLAIVSDLGSAIGVQDVISQVRAALGPIDLWCSNAALSHAADLLDVPDEVWQRAWQLNVMSHVQAVRTLLPGWLEGGHGHVCQTVSTVALTLNHYDPSYAVTKRAALAVNEYLAVRYGHRGIGVTAFCPRGMLTERLRRATATIPAAKRALATAVTPEQAADLVVNGIREGRFLVLTEADEFQSHRAKAEDLDAWLEARRTQFAVERAEMTPPDAS